MKHLVQTITNILVLIGLIASGVFYFTDFKTNSAVLNNRVDTDEKNFVDLSSKVDRQVDDIGQQGKDIAIIKYYFEHGVLQRLQLDSLKQAASAELITSTN